MLMKQQPDETMSLSEKLLIESAAEKNRISEAKVMLPKITNFAHNCAQK